MKVISLVDNVSNGGLKAKHGLCFYIETINNKILFDLGPDKTFIKNAEKYNIDLKKIDTVVISHGHFDHGGALKYFLDINNSAKIYIQRKAFDRYYSKILFLKINIGLDKSLMNHEQIVLVDGDYCINNELELFVVENKYYETSSANKVLFKNDSLDEFMHEQNLIIKEDSITTLITGCGHSGVANIMEKAKYYDINVYIGGFHLINPFTKKVANDDLKSVVSALRKYHDITFYTCHCTGKKGYEILNEEVNNLSYIACGNDLEFGMS